MQPAHRWQGPPPKGRCRPADHSSCSSARSNLDGNAGEINDTFDIFVRNLSTNQTERLTLGKNITATGFSISADGSRLVFHTDLALVPADTNVSETRISSNRAAAPGSQLQLVTPGSSNGATLGPRISRDGTTVAFQSLANNLLGVGGDTNGVADVFVKVLSTGAITLAGPFGNLLRGISADGRKIAFSTTATVPAQMVVKDLDSGQTWNVHAAADGTLGDSEGIGAVAFTDSQSIVFHSIASNLVAGDTNAMFDVFLKSLPFTGANGPPAAQDGG